MMKPGFAGARAAMVRVAGGKRRRERSEEAAE